MDNKRRRSSRSNVVIETIDRDLKTNFDLYNQIYLGKIVKIEKIDYIIVNFYINQKEILVTCINYKNLDTYNDSFENIKNGITFETIDDKIKTIDDNYLKFLLADMKKDFGTSILDKSVINSEKSGGIESLSVSANSTNREIINKFINLLIPDCNDPLTYTKDIAINDWDIHLIKPHILYQILFPGVDPGSDMDCFIKVLIIACNKNEIFKLLKEMSDKYKNEPEYEFNILIELNTILKQYNFYNTSLYFTVDSTPGRKELRPLPSIFQSFENKKKLYNIKFPIDKIDDTTSNDVLTQIIKDDDRKLNYDINNINIEENIQCNLLPIFIINNFWGVNSKNIEVNTNTQYKGIINRKTVWDSLSKQINGIGPIDSEILPKLICINDTLLNTFLYIMATKTLMDTIRAWSFKEFTKSTSEGICIFIANDQNAVLQSAKFNKQGRYCSIYSKSDGASIYTDIQIAISQGNLSQFGYSENGFIHFGKSKLESDIKYLLKL